MQEKNKKIEDYSWCSAAVVRLRNDSVTTLHRVKIDSKGGDKGVITG